MAKDAILLGEVAARRAKMIEIRYGRHPDLKDNATLPCVQNSSRSAHPIWLIWRQ